MIRIVVVIRCGHEFRSRGGRGECWRRSIFILFVLIERPFKLLLDSAGGFLEFANGFTEAPRKFRELFATEQHEDNNDDQPHLRTANAFDEC